MARGRYKVEVYESKELEGLTGDHGEEYCVMVRDLASPLDSAWTWCATREAAEHLAEILGSRAAEP